MSTTDTTRTTGTTGATATLGSALVIGAAGSIGRATAEALGAAGARVLAAGRERDATDPAQVAALLAEADPDLVVVAAGARPRMAPLGEQDWESFSTTWNVDVRIAYEVGRAVLARPLRPGSTVVIVSSGAALGGSPLSGGYAGAKRMQMFLAGYLQSAADARALGIRFVALVPSQLVADTPIGQAAAAAYGAEAGQSPAAYLAAHYPDPLDPPAVARAVVALATGAGNAEGTTLKATPTGLTSL